MMLTLTLTMIVTHTLTQSVDPYPGTESTSCGPMTLILIDTLTYTHPLTLINLDPILILTHQVYFLRPYP